MWQEVMCGIAAVHFLKISYHSFLQSPETVKTLPPATETPSQGDTKVHLYMHNS
jgi:hypothetical protein